MSEPESEHIVEVPVELTEPEEREILVHTPHIPAKGCNHFFVRMDAEEVKCRNCGMGLFVNPTDRIDEGKLVHIY